MIKMLRFAVVACALSVAASGAYAQPTCSKIKANCPKNCRANVGHPSAQAKCPSICQANWEKCMQTGQWCSQGKCKAATKK